MTKSSDSDSPIDRIFDEFFARLRKGDAMDEQAIKRLEALQASGKLSDLQELKAALAECPGETQ